MLLGPQTLLHLFRNVPDPLGQPWWLAMFCLLAPRSWPCA